MTKVFVVLFFAPSVSILIFHSLALPHHILFSLLTGHVNHQERALTMQNIQTFSSITLTYT